MRISCEPSATFVHISWCFSSCRKMLARSQLSSAVTACAIACSSRSRSAVTASIRDTSSTRLICPAVMPPDAAEAPDAPEACDAACPWACGAGGEAEVADGVGCDIGAYVTVRPAGSYPDAPPSTRGFAHEPPPCVGWTFSGGGGVLLGFVLSPAVRAPVRGAACAGGGLRWFTCARGSQSISCTSYTPCGTYAGKSVGFGSQKPALRTP